MSTLHSHTHCQAAQANAKTQAWQRVCLSLRTSNRQRDDKKEGRTGNMRLASCGVKWLNSSSVFQLEFCSRLTVLSSEIPHERQAPATLKTMLKESSNFLLMTITIYTMFDELDKYNQQDHFFFNEMTD